MNMRKLVQMVLVLGLIATLSCTREMPPEPVRDNPLDPANPETGGIPYNLTALIANGGVRLDWTPLENFGEVGYNLYRRVNEGAEFQLLQTVGYVSSTTDQTVQNGNRYEYVIAAVFPDGEAYWSDTAAVAISTDPLLVIEGGQVSSTPTRFVTLTILAFGSEKMLLSNNTDFAGAEWEDYQTSREWALPTGAGMKSVYLKVVHAAGDTSATISDAIAARLPSNPGVEVVGGDTTETYLVAVHLTADDADSVRLGNEPDLSNQPWIAFSDTIQNWDLYAGGDWGQISTSRKREVGKPVRKAKDRRSPKNVTACNSELDETTEVVYAQFKNSFEVPSDVVSDNVVLDIQTSVLINNDDEATASRFVTLSLSTITPHKMAIDTSYTRINNTPQWQQFAALVEDFELPKGAGAKTVYARFRFDNGGVTEIVSDNIQAQLVENAAVEIVSPTDNDTVYSLTVDLALQADYADSVMISNFSDLHDGHWIAMTDTVTGWSLSGTSTGGQLQQPEKRSQRKRISPTMSGAQFNLDDANSVVYARFKNSFDVPSTVSDEIYIDMGVSVSINNGATHTVSRLVTVYLDGNDVEQVAIDTSHTNLMDNPDWQALTPTIQDVELPLGPGEKRVYARFQFTGDMGELVIYDEILPAEINPALVIQPDDSSYITYHDVTVETPGVQASEMLISESPDSTGGAWQTYAASQNVTLSPGDGWKTLYAWFRNDFYTAGPVRDSIAVDTEVGIASFTWTSTGEENITIGDEISFTLTMAQDGIGVEDGGSATVTINGWEPIPLTDQGDGAYASNFEITEDTPGAIDDTVTVTFTDRAGNGPVTDTAADLLTVLYAGMERVFDLGVTGETITMVWIPPGSFTMGSPTSDPDSQDDERPQHLVTLDYGFWMGKYEVTQAQWVSLIGSNPSYFQGDNRPVESVSWNDVHEFIGGLNSMSPGAPWRLPSEAEWEYACRADTDTRFWWGDDLNETEIGLNAWYAGNNDPNGTKPVGQKQPNPWGLYDMSGNIWEWCSDWYDSDYYETSPGVDPQGPATGYYRVLRGGSWNRNAGHCRSPNRGNDIPSLRSSSKGFRLLRSGE